jgi:hypothetical protein
LESFINIKNGKKITLSFETLVTIFVETNLIFRQVFAKSRTFVVELFTAILVQIIIVLTQSPDSESFKFFVSSHPLNKTILGPGVFGACAFKLDAIGVFDAANFLTGAAGVFIKTFCLDRTGDWFWWQINSDHWFRLLC